MSISLCSYQANDLVSSVKHFASSAGIRGAFNPSVAFVGDTLVATLRGEERPGARPFRAWVLWGALGKKLAGASLTDAMAEHGVHPVADPKLFVAGEKVFATFNTGYVRTGINDIYVVEVFPNIGWPQRCVFSGRQRIEKNWAFFQSGSGDLAALYSAVPPQLLKLTQGELGTSSDLVFDGSGIGLTNVSDRFTIGSQLAWVSESEAMIVLHEKHRILNKRAYTGRLALLSISDRVLDKLEIRMGKTRLIHSRIATLPQLRPNNPNLISATYFSGLAPSADGLVLSYGVNDRDFGIARLDVGQETLLHGGWV